MPPRTSHVRTAPNEDGEGPNKHDLRSFLDLFGDWRDLGAVDPHETETAE